MVSCVTNTNSGRGKMQNAGKLTKPESHYKKKIVGRVNAWKKRGEKWWHPRFPNIIKYILLLELIVEGWRCGVSRQRSRALDATPPSENTFKNYSSCWFPSQCRTVWIWVWLSSIFPRSSSIPSIAKSPWKLLCVRRWENKGSACQGKAWQTAKHLMYLLGETSGLLSQHSAELFTRGSVLVLLRD